MASETDKLVYLENQLSLARREINNLRQQVKSLGHLHRKECEEISSKLTDWQCMACRSRVGEAASAEPDDSLLMRHIGVISTNFPEKRGTPRQPGVCAASVAKLTLNATFTNPGHALEGLQEFSHMWVLFHFHRNGATHVRAKVAPPRLNGRRTGVLATRSPHRPNPVGLSLVRIERVADGAVYFSGVDMVDGTPVLDVKPYIPRYDVPSAAEELGRGGGAGAVGGEGAEGAAADVEEMSYARLHPRMGEREAPDGEEEESSSSGAVGSVSRMPATTEAHIRVPAWIDQPVVMEVIFKDRALEQLAQLGIEGEQKKAIITNVLREDPRSIYLRERWGSHCYVFRISELYVSCKFNDVSHSVFVYQVFQNEAPENID